VFVRATGQRGTVEGQVCRPDLVFVVESSCAGHTTFPGRFFYEQ
jgi:hypothetical protein